MKKTVFILFLLSAAKVLCAQTAVDSLCAGPGSPEYKAYCRQHRISGIDRILRSGDSRFPQRWEYIRDSAFAGPDECAVLRYGHLAGKETARWMVYYYG